MDECFDKREKIIYERGRPIIDYQAVCVPSTNKMTKKDKVTFFASVSERQKYEW